MNESLILYKLMILYMLDSVTFPLTNSQITEFILEREYTDYFTIQQSFSELSESKLIQMEKLHHSSHYTITEEGIQTLAFYRHIIPDGIMEDVDAYLKKHKIELKNRVSILATYEPLKDQEYSVHFRIIEEETTLLDMDIKVPSQELAERMCSRWPDNHEQLYSYIMNLLALQPDEKN